MHRWLIRDLSPGPGCVIRSHRFHVMEFPVLTDSWVCHSLECFPLLTTLQGVLKFMAAPADAPV